MHHSVFIFSTRSVLLILFYHLTAFGQPRYGDIGQSVLAWMCIPYKKRDFSVSGTCVPCRKIPSGLLLYSFMGKGYKEWVKVSDGGPYIKAKIRLG